MADKTLVEIPGGRVAYVGAQGHVELDLPDGKVATFTVGISPEGELADECAAEEQARNDAAAALAAEEAAHLAESGAPAPDTTLTTEGAALDAELGKQEPPALTGDLPEGFPALTPLANAGITTYEALVAARDPEKGWTDIDGIGEPTSAKIATALGE